MTELFDNFEINREPRWPILLRLVGCSFALHVLFVLLVLYVPGVRNALNIGYMLSSAGYVDKAYNKTSIEDRATVIDLANEKFQYPEGYFATTAPQPDPLAAQVIEQANAAPPPQMPKIIPTPTPLPSPPPSPSPLPSASPSASGTTEAAVADKPKTPEEIDQDLNKVAAENNITRPDEGAINKRPLKDWLARANQMKVKGELDLSGVIELVIEAEIDPSGKLQNSKIVQKTGDPKLVAVTTDFVAALSDSNVLYFLKDPEFPNDNRKMRLTVRMDQAEVLAHVETEARTPERAKELATGYNGLLFLGQLQKKGKDEEVIYKNTKISADGKQVIVDFKMPRADAGAMLSKQVPAS